MGNQLFNFLFKKIKEKLTSKKEKYEKNEIDHKWRPCPTGYHWVRNHNRESKNGELYKVEGHCRKNQNGLDFLKGDEIEYLSQTYLFKNPKLKISNIELGFEDENKFNELIEGWTYYWNEIFKVEPSLHPNDIKVLIATESGFNANEVAKNRSKVVGNAQGLIQITQQTQKILSGEIKELTDNFVILSDEDIWDANKNICAAIRWLYRKREIAKTKLKRNPTWEEVIYEYKGIQFDHSERSKRIKKKVKSYLDKIYSGKTILNFLIYMLSLNIYASEIKKIKHTKREIYIEVQSKDVKVFCTKVNPDKLSFTSLEVKDKDITYDFTFRRPWPIETCIWHKEEIKKILVNNKFVRILGSQPDFDENKKIEYDFNGNKYSFGKSITSIFERIDNGNKQCHAYFQNTYCLEFKNIK